MNRTTWAAPIAALLLLVCGAPVASADSIAYVKDGNVFLSTPDGSRQYQVTTAGGYSDVSQADDGTMIALNGVRLHKLARARIRARRLRHAGLRHAPGAGEDVLRALRPGDLAGRHEGRVHVLLHDAEPEPDLLPAHLRGRDQRGRHRLHVLRSPDGLEGAELGYHSGWRHPSWIDNDNTMLSNPTHMPNRDIILDQVSDGGNGHANVLRNWTSDLVDGNPHVSGGDITRDKRKLAFQTGENDATLTVYFVPEMPTSWRDGNPNVDAVHVCYRYKDPVGGKHGVPTFSPDGGGLAFATGDGIHVAAVPAFSAGCTTEGATVTPPLVIAGGSEPDWGPADVPAARSGSSSGSVVAPTRPHRSRSP